MAAGLNLSRDIISASTTIYVFNTNGSCTKQNSFVISIIPKVIESIFSSHIPNLSFGNYYTEAAGRGTLIPLEQKSTIQRRYMYAKTTTIPTVLMIFFNINIKPIPLVDN
jgi:hypothetical protein